MHRKFDSYRLSRRAEVDLADIYAYTVEHWSVDQANSYIADIRAAITGLAEGAKVGRRRSEIAPGYLSYGVGSHLIFYRETEHILVARVLHAAMDLPRHLGT
jgi:toxin ParE1/3/4